MTDPALAANLNRRRPWGRKIGSISMDKPPSKEEVDYALERHKGDDADRFSLYGPEQIEKATVEARIAMTFKDAMKIRDQAEMIKAAMEIVIKLTRDHDRGSINQRIECRREIASLVERLTLFNGGTPYGYKKRKG
jgi:hypothetical protein